MQKFAFLFACTLIFSIPGFSQDCYKILDCTHFYSKMLEHPNHILLDTRIADEYRQGHIPGACNVPGTERLYEVLDSLDKAQPVLLYCDAYSRSETAAGYVCNEGFGHVYILGEELSRWRKQGYRWYKAPKPSIWQRIRNLFSGQK